MDLSRAAICISVGQAALSASYTLYHEGDPPGQTTYTTRIYTDYTSLVNNTPVASDTAGVTHGTGVSLGGLAWNGSQYVVLRESDPGGLNNVGLAFYDTYTDLINNNFSDSVSWGTASWGTGVSVVGLAHDGNEYLLMLESDPGGLNNFNVARFATFNDLRTRNFTGSSFLGQNYISPFRSIGGLAGIAPTDPGGPPVDPSPVPLPASALVLISAFMLLGGLRRRRG